MLLSLSSAMRGRSGNAMRGRSGNANDTNANANDDTNDTNDTKAPVSPEPTSTPTPADVADAPSRDDGACHTPSSATRDGSLASSGRRDVVVGETPEGVKGPHGSSSSSTAATAAVVTDRPSTAKKQRSIHDFFGSRRTPTTSTSATPTARKPRGVVLANGLVQRRLSGGRGSNNSSSHSLPDSEELVKKRIDYDDTSSLDENDDDDDDHEVVQDEADDDEVDMMEEEALSLSQNSEAAATPQPRSSHHHNHHQHHQHHVTLPFGRPASVSVVKPKRIDFGGICPSSQRSEPDVEPLSHAAVSVVVPAGTTAGLAHDSLVRSSSQSASQSFGYGGYGGYSAYGGGMFSQDDLDFCTPADQPVVHMSHPTTPSPMKKRPRRSSISDVDADAETDGAHVIQEEVQNLTQDMTHMGVRRAATATTTATRPVRGGTGTTSRLRGARAAPLPSFSSSNSQDMLLATPQRVLGPPTGFASGAAAARRRDAPPSLASGSTPFAIAKGTAAPPASSSSSVESFTNPFAPVPAVDSRKRRKFRQSFPPTFGGSSSVSVPYSRYLSEFVEQEILGTGAFSKVLKCVKKIDGWTYAIKKSKRHLRGRADTERALREVQALAALSGSRHIVRYFDAWIEDDLLYIQLEHCASCSLATFVDAHKPLHVPEETLCKVLCHLAQALQDLHAQHMVHMDVKLPNVLIAPGDMYKLGDLGTVALADGSMDITEGDSRYLSRELLEGSRANLKAGDVFALGATIYELALGTTLPNGGEEWQKIRDGDLSLFRQYTNSLQHLIASMMHPDPLQRPAADEILQHEVVRPYWSR